MKEKIKLAYIGLGRRGTGVLKREFSNMSDVEMTVLCDLIPERLENAKNICKENSGHEPITTTNYKDILDMDVDAVLIFVGWSGRPGMAMEFMRAGKFVGMEVGCADSLDECFELVRTYEETGVQCMMLENCCYGRRELAATNMARKGLLGEIVHCTGAYKHYLNDADLFKELEEDGSVSHYRINQYIEKNRENYPTHALGPISKLLGINRGNRMIRLSSFASKSRGINQYAATRFGADNKYATQEYKQGDIINTVITCEGGETILLTLDTTLPRPFYSRDFSVRGTLGAVDESRRSVYFHGMEEGAKTENNEEEMLKEHDHPLYVEYLNMGIKEKEGHGGIDWLMCRGFVDCVRRGIHPPIDIYDTALWLSIGPLSEMSIKGGGIPVEIPDFTKGLWKNREPVDKSKYALDEVFVSDETPIYPE